MKNGSPAKVVSKQSRTGLSSLAEARLRRSLRRTAPSEPWVDNARVFPPGGAQTAMRRCPRCGVFTPPAAFEAGVCLDHAEHGNWGRSPSAVAIAALQHLNLRLIDPPLPSESVTALRAEIARFNKGSRLPKGSGNPKRKKEPAAGKGGGGNLSGECRRCS
jgi:hypothetical protein